MDAEGKLVCRIIITGDTEADTLKNPAGLALDVLV